MNNRLQRNQNSCCHDMVTPTCGESMTYDPLQAMPLAMAYVPWQQWQNVYECSKGLEHGTIFEELIFPFQHASRVCGNSRECRNNERMERYERTRPHERMDRRERTEQRERMEQRERASQCQRMEHCERAEQRQRMERCERRCD